MPGLVPSAGSQIPETKYPPLLYLKLQYCMEEGTDWDNGPLRQNRVSITLKQLGLCDNGNSLITIVQLCIAIITIMTYIYEVYQNIVIFNCMS